jgi:hypothetical protein
MSLTPRTMHLAERASKEMDSGKLMHLITKLCDAFDDEQEENRQSRRGCLEDCREYKQSPPGSQSQAA